MIISNEYQNNGYYSNVYLQDCIAGMKQYTDGYFDLAVIDPPYGIGAGAYTRGGTRHGNSKAKCKEYTIKNWDSKTPSGLYFQELFRVSKNQIIFGANHFISKIPYDSPCWIVWDKQNGNNGYADCELAWTSFKTSVRRFLFRWAGMLQEDMKNKEIRIHPTQKPVELYNWIFQKYAKEGDLILDTHLGSQSSRIAALKNNLNFIGFEIDEEYFTEGNQRFKTYAPNGVLF